MQLFKIIVIKLSDNKENAHDIPLAGDARVSIYVQLDGS